MEPGFFLREYSIVNSLLGDVHRNMIHTNMTDKRNNQRIEEIRNGMIRTLITQSQSGHHQNNNI